ncbi:MAG: bi-domain-containing oxidoreductase [Thaumarchaeota archaeon]|nr:bi-domain-containing oxidoreductase [Nitrososphaerota archaeon]
MKQVIARAGKVVVADVPSPVCGEDGLLIRTNYSVISTGTESWTIDSTDPLATSDLIKDSSLASKALKLSREVLRQEGVSGLIDYADYVRHPEVTLGYSSSGIVVEVGRNVKDVLVGDRMACAGEGKACHAELVSVPRNLAAKVPTGLSMKEAAFATIGTIAIHAVRIGQLQVGETVGVIGVGLVGNLVAQIAKASGCKVVCIDLKDARLALAVELGVDLALKADDPTLVAHISNFTRGIGLDHVLVCAATASSDPLNMAARIARNRGRIVVVGRVGMEIERKDFYQKELSLLMSRSLGPGRYDPLYEEKGIDYPIEYVRWTLNRNMEAFMDLLSAKRVRVADLVGAEYPLDSAPEAYDSLVKQTKTAVLLSYDIQKAVGRRADETTQQQPAAATTVPVVGKINVAVVGPGNFAKEILIPLMRASPEYNLRWVVSSNPTHATRVADRYRFEKSTCEYNDALNDPGTNLVVITAPNNLHYPMLAAAMKASKTALVEKPLCITRDEFEEIKKLHAELNQPVIVGFNRRYAPLVLKIKDRMKKIDGPFVINYRVNAGFVLASRWSQDPSVGGGRIIHECCHFFDLFNFLLGRDDPEIVVRSAGINGSSSVARDNLSITLDYPDGSMATLLYVAMGSKDMDRERMEIFGQGNSMVLDDFKELHVYGAQPETVSLGRADKGHSTEFAELAKFLHGSSSSIITSEEVFSATELTFRVDEAARRPSPP